MGEAKRRKEVLGDDYGKEERLYSWLPLSKTQAKKAYELTTRGAWAGIAALAFGWIAIRFIGPAFGWWDVQ